MAVETSEYGKMMGRMLRSYGRRVGGMDVEELKGLADFAADAERTVGETVAQLRSPAGGGYSWAQIAAVLGVSRSAAQHRYERYGIAGTVTGTSSSKPLA